MVFCTNAVESLTLTTIRFVTLYWQCCLVFRYPSEHNFDKANKFADWSWVSQLKVCLVLQKLVLGSGLITDWYQYHCWYHCSTSARYIQSMCLLNSKQVKHSNQRMRAVSRALAAARAAASALAVYFDASRSLCCVVCNVINGHRGRCCVFPPRV